ncbi:hypothetical protein P7K49_025052 [Saguinus oedipus]|uniref:Uncharacterized protein n=1 Tax=Saguinus oedipus TaxID=9490 RepID=A0ABQ9UG28_SAGOE|nr:hypothetical protein P7K49_025052 [Saguinus oedipus]
MGRGGPWICLNLIAGGPTPHQSNTALAYELNDNMGRHYKDPKPESHKRCELHPESWFIERAHHASRRNGATEVTDAQAPSLLGCCPRQQRSTTYAFGKNSACDKKQKANFTPGGQQEEVCKDEDRNDLNALTERDGKYAYLF